MGEEIGIEFNSSSWIPTVILGIVSFLCAILFTRFDLLTKIVSSVIFLAFILSFFIKKLPAGSFNNETFTIGSINKLKKTMKWEELKGIEYRNNEMYLYFKGTVSFLISKLFHEDYNTVLEQIKNILIKKGLYSKFEK